MALCPHCQADAIPFYAKAWSSAADPAKCRSCGRLSYIANTHGTSVGRALGTSLPFLAIVALFLTGALWPLAVGALIVLGALAYEIAAFRRTPMLPTTAEGVASARHWQRVGLAILGVLALLILAYALPL